MAFPWLLNANRIADLFAAPTYPRVVLVIGGPSADDLGPLLSSSRLADSLIIIAVHNPPSIQSATTIPAVRILPLSAPFSLENAGAVTLVPILERAERVARIWRNNPLMGIFELREGDDGANLLPAGISKRHSHPLPTPAASSEHVNTSSSMQPQNRWSKVSIISPKRLSLFGTGLPPVDPTQRPFDDVFNFLPLDIPEKSLLKHAILITTMSHPFLCAQSDPGDKEASPPAKSAADGLASTRPPKRWTAFKRLWTKQPGSQGSAQPVRTASADHQHSAGKAHLVHLLPYTPSITYPSTAGRPRFVNSLESFLQSFSYSSQLLIRALSDSRNGIHFVAERAASYTLPAASLAQKVQCGPNPNDSRPTSASSTGSTTLSVSPDNINSGAPIPPFECTVTDLILRGILDPPSPATTQSTIKQRQKQKAVDASNLPRVWINGANDFIVLGSHWSSGNAANLTKLSLAARPGLGGGGGESRGPRARVATGRVLVRPAPGGGSMGMRSASTSNVESVVQNGVNRPAPPALTRAETDMIVAAIKKHSPPSRASSVGRKPVPAYRGESQATQNVRDVAVMSKLRQVYVPEESDDEDGGLATPPDSEGSEESSGVVTAPTSVSNHGMDDEDGDVPDDAKGTSGAKSTGQTNENGVRKTTHVPLKMSLMDQGRWKSWKGGVKSVESLRVAA